jgi:aspartyl-tRNA synthetase
MQSHKISSLRQFAANYRNESKYMSGSLTPSVNATALRTHLCGSLRPEHIGQTVTLCGWIARRREHGEHLAFLDVRDYSGVVQCVVSDVKDVRNEWVVQITGKVQARPEGTVNANLPTGGVELVECQLTVLNAAESPPFPIDARADDVDEGVRLKFRYLDIRRERMQKNLRIRAKVNSAIRGAMEAQNFVEVETPFLMPSTPEGAREFLVPSRKEPGSFYALPQSPQLWKQLLMVAGIDRYYQIARCLRDEDLRADRQYEFMQLDAEMSFVTKDDVLAAISQAVVAAAEAALGQTPPPIEQITWHDAMNRFGSDKPDLRFGMELIELTDVFAATEFKAFATAKSIKGLRVDAATYPEAAASGRSKLDAFTDRAKQMGAKGLVWIKVGEDLALDSPVAKFLSDTERAALLQQMQAKSGDLLLLVADEWSTSCEVLGHLRNDIGRPPVHEGPYRYVWVIDFPLFVGINATTGKPQPGHHPFCQPHPDDIERLETDPMSVRALAYDLVLNGWELGSGSIRIHDPEMQRRVFRQLGISDEDADRRFGFFLQPFKYGAPPHGGFAFGTDRLVAILAGEENIREVIAFPKTQSGSDPMTNAPTPVDPAQLNELGIRLLPPPAKS